MEAHIYFQGRHDPPRLAAVQQPIIDLCENETIGFCLCEGGMMSGDHSVVIFSSDAEGTVAMQTSLDKLLTAAQAMVGYAEEHWGWKRQEGHFTLLPPSKATRKTMLEAIQKELQEWDDADD